MKRAKIDELSGAEFSTSEISEVRRIIVDKTFTETRLLLDTLTIFESDIQDPVEESNQSERKLMRSHIIIYFDKFLDGSIKVKGGKRGTDFDNTRDKSELRKEVRRMLGLPSMTDEELLEWEILNGTDGSDVSGAVPIQRVA